jgi:asparagine synthase (glutamine-hydrolysing)
LQPLLESLTDSMRHRGPDGRGSYQDAKVFLGHRRLSIIDLTDGGAQPMFSSDGKRVIVFNGEIYNYVELKEELQQQGIVFKASSDTEVLLELISKRGPKSIKQLNGMFAFALWNRQNESLFVVRDRIGIKPVYYIDTPRITAFASDIRALLPLLDEIRINDGIVYDFLSRARVDHSSETFFQGIFKLTPGCFALVENNELRISRWYNLDSRVESLNSTKVFKIRNDMEHIAEVHELFNDAVRIRLRSDVPVGSCLSGGIDSSSIVVAAASMIPKKELHNFQSFSAVFGQWFSKDETRYIEAVKEKCGIQGHDITPTPELLDRMFDHFIANQEEPVTGASPFSQYCVMQLAHSYGAKVLLDGQGADEILAGYDFMVGFYLAELLYHGKFHRFLKEAYLQIKRRNKYAIRTGISQYLPNFLRKYARTPNLLIASELARRHENRQVLGPVVIRPPSLRYALIQYVTIHIQHLLKWEDKNSMAFSIETRLPFLDYRFLEYVLALPSRLIIKNGITKWILREAMNDKLPSIVLRRTDKIGFATPEYEWLRTKSVATITNLSENIHPQLRDYVNLNALHRILKLTPETVNADTWNFIFRVAALNSWLKTFFPSKTPMIAMDSTKT